MMRELLRQLSPIVGEDKVAKWWRLYLISDEKERRELQRIIEAHAAKLLGDHPNRTPPGLFPPPPPHICAGDIALGKIKYGGTTTASIGLKTEELPRHVGIYGSSGSGKSNAIALILDGLCKAGIPWLLIDFKRTFRALLKDDPEALVFTAGDNTSPFAFNPLIPPPGTKTDVWTKKVVGALSHAYCQGAGSESILVSAIQQAYERTMDWPTFVDVAKILDDEPARGRKAMWMDSARRAVKSVCDGNAGETFCPDSPLDLIQLLDKKVVIELDSLNQCEQTFFAEALMLFIIQERTHNNEARERLKHAIVIEEAHHLLRSPPGVGDGTEPVIHTALREIRELGESVVLATQNASVVPLQVFGNQATTLAFHTKHQRDLHSTAQAMLLQDEAKDELGRLPVGEAILRVPRWHSPVHIALDYRPVAKGEVTDTHIRQAMASRGYSTCSAPKRPQTREIPQSKGIPVAERETSRITESSSQRVACPPTTLEKELLKDIVRHPFDGVVKRFGRLGASRRKGTAALKSLEDRGLIKPAHVYTGTSLIKLFDLTKTGRLCAHHLDLKLPNPTDGGVSHRYWVAETARQLREDGWNVKTEYNPTTDVRVDVHATKADRTIAVLIETGKSDIEKNVKATLDVGYEHVIILPTTPTTNIRHASTEAVTVVPSRNIVQTLTRF